MKYKFSYTPQYSDILYLAAFLLGFGIIALRNSPVYLILYLIFVLVSIWMFIESKPKILFFEDYIELHRGIFFNKRIRIKKYEDILSIQYCFAEIRGSNLFKISLKDKDNKVNKIQYSFLGRPTKYEVSFFQSKNIDISVVPDSAKNKLPS
ncbi:MAG: hypothetical protein IPM95_00130 [Sphingobacteriales bacterium]|jgi:hypothetical protein|nr:hypothetical protein [Sphingobacteriales bacterium]